MFPKDSTTPVTTAPAPIKVPTLSPFNILPLEVLSNILCCLHPHQVFQLRRVNRDFNQWIIPTFTSDLQFAKVNLQLMWDAWRDRAAPKYDEYFPTGFGWSSWPHLGLAYHVAFLTTTTNTKNCKMWLLCEEWADLVDEEYDRRAMDKSIFKKLREAIIEILKDSSVTKLGHPFLKDYFPKILDTAMALGDIELLECLLERTPAEIKASHAKLLQPQQIFNFACSFGDLNIVRHILTKTASTLKITLSNIERAMMTKNGDTVMLLYSECLKDGRNSIHPTQLIERAADFQCHEIIEALVNEAKALDDKGWAGLVLRELVASVRDDRVETLNVLLELTIKNNLELNGNAIDDIWEDVMSCDNPEVVKALFRYPQIKETASYNSRLFYETIESEKWDFVELIAPLFSISEFERILKVVGESVEGLEVLERIRAKPMWGDEDEDQDEDEEN